VSVLISEGESSGHAFCHHSGKVIKSATLGSEFHTQLEIIQEKRTDLIIANINFRESFSVFRSLSRDSSSRVGELGILDNIVNLHNRWRKVEAGSGFLKTSNMQANYTELRLT